MLFGVAVAVCYAVDTTTATAACVVRSQRRYLQWLRGQRGHYVWRGEQHIQRFVCRQSSRAVVFFGGHFEWGPLDETARFSLKVYALRARQDPPLPSVGCGQWPTGSALGPVTQVGHLPQCLIRHPTPGVGEKWSQIQAFFAARCLWLARGWPGTAAPTEAAAQRAPAGQPKAGDKVD